MAAISPLHGVDWEYASGYLFNTDRFTAVETSLETEIEALPKDERHTCAGSLAHGRKKDDDRGLRRIC
jgi:hypothetical protein